MRLFALQESLALGEAVASRLGIMLDPIEDRRFDDGENKVRPLVSVRGEEVYIIQTLSGDQANSVHDRLCKLLFFVATCRENGAAQVSVVAPYMAYARKDRQTKPRDPVTIKYVAQLFEAMGITRVIAVEVHNPAAFQNAFRCPTINLSPFHLFYPAIRDAARDDPLVILSPDAGGVKRAQLVREELERFSGEAVGLALMEKRRSQGVVSGDLFAGDVAGKTVIIVDDLIVSGTTLIRAAHASLERGAKKVVAIAAHGRFSRDDSALFSDPAISHIYVTDSVSPVPQQTVHPDKLTVVSLATSLGEVIKRLSANESVSELTGLIEPEAPVQPR